MLLKAFTVLGLLFSLTTQAQSLTCLNKLLPYNKHSGLHQLTREEWNDEKESLDPEAARSALNFLITSRLLCKSSEVVIKVQPTCAPLLADFVQSQSCFVFTNLGYFILSKDNGRNVNFIFSKDKRFAE